MSSSASTPAFSPKSLYLAGFAQVGDTHAGLLLATDEANGRLWHVKYDHNKEKWIREAREQKIRGSITLTTLIKLHDVSAGEIDAAQVDAIAAKIDVPKGGPGECLDWIINLIQALNAQGILKVTSLDDLRAEFKTFAGGNREFARGDRFPNMKNSDYCT